MKVLIVEDQTLVSDLLISELKVRNISASATTTIEGTFRKLASESFDIVMLDVNLDSPIKLNEIRDIVKRAQTCKVALFSGTENEVFIQNCLDIGVRGLIPKTFSIDSVISTLHLICSGQIFVPLSIQSSRPKNLEKFSITQSELLVLQKLSDGMSNKEITDALNIPETTVKMRVRSICKKLGADNRTQALIYAQRVGLL